MVTARVQLAPAVGVAVSVVSTAGSAPSGVVSADSGSSDPAVADLPANIGAKLAAAGSCAGVPAPPFRTFRHGETCSGTTEPALTFCTVTRHGCPRAQHRRRGGRASRRGPRGHGAVRRYRSDGRSERRSPAPDRLGG